jgi:hypothetical protein
VENVTSDNCVWTKTSVLGEGGGAGLGCWSPGFKFRMERILRFRSIRNL